MLELEFLSRKRNIIKVSTKHDSSSDIMTVTDSILTYQLVTFFAIQSFRIKSEGSCIFDLLLLECLIMYRIVLRHVRIIHLINE